VIVEVYQPKFEALHGKHIVIWEEVKRGPHDVQIIRGPYVAYNLYSQYMTWRSTKQPKHEPMAAFWDSNGPALCRALHFCGCDALTFEYVSDRKVCYRWWTRKPSEQGGKEPDRWCICPITAEGGRPGVDTRVLVTMPTDEDVSFLFRAETMKSWLKPEPVAEETKTP
jgi:hypothetical protein